MRHLRALVVRLTVLLFAAAVAAAAAPAGDGPGTPIARGVRAGDVVLTGLTAQPARERLRRELIRPLRFRADGKRWHVPATKFIVVADVDAIVRNALRAQPGAALPLEVQLDKKAIRAQVARLDRRWSRPAVDTELTGLDGALRPVFSEPVAGRRVDTTAVRRAIRNALTTGRRQPIRLRFLPVEPTLTARDFGPIVVIRRGSNTLTLYDGPQLVRTFRVATGSAEYPTPLGRYEVVDMQYNPWWIPPPSDWAKGLKPVPPGPGNPLGTRWMGISSPGVGIHGTPDAASIGYSASHGCIRMYVPEAEWLFERVRHGTPVFIVSA